MIKNLTIKDNRAMNKIFGNPKLFSGVVACMKSDHELGKPNLKYPMKAIRNFFFGKSYLLTHRMCDLKKGGPQVWQFYLLTQTLFGSNF